MIRSVRSLPLRYKFGFLTGGASLVLVIFLWMSSRTNGDLIAQENLLAPAIPPPVVAAGNFPRGATLHDMLKKASLSAQRAHEVSQALARILDPRSLRDSDRYELVLTSVGLFQRLTVVRELQKYVVEATEGPALTASKQEIPVQTREAAGSGRLTSSLWEAMRGQGLDPQVIMEFADIFAWNVDFLTELREGDRYSLVWEERTTPDGAVAGRRVTAALFDGHYSGRHTALLLDGEYYSPEGDSLRKAFLHAPLNFRRISSGFTRKRFHPILRYFRPHLGTDYAAPTGTPVVSVGDGVVIFKGWKKAYGNFVQVRHNGTYTTCYGHFSRFAKGLRSGSRVKQGQVIGYVGATGYATGPHLDFRVIQNGRFVNFLKLKFPSDKKVAASQKAAFDELKAKRLPQLERLLERPTS
ncbi:MAG: M23 family metallopeptidase [Elusimicrobia bacterium]|nr:M23 family metallopeptidase [Elusimicrobiota bacterium]